MRLLAAPHGNPAIQIRYRESAKHPRVQPVENPSQRLGEFSLEKVPNASGFCLRPARRMPR
jgi:hypothetical protein